MYISLLKITSLPMLNGFFLTTEDELSLRSDSISSASSEGIHGCSAGVPKRLKSLLE